MKGGAAIWGNESFAPDDLPSHKFTHGKFLSFRPPHDHNCANLTVDDASTWILEHTPTTFQVGPVSFLIEMGNLMCAQRMLETNYSYGIERDEERLKANDMDPTKWSNPLEVRYVSVLPTPLYV